MKGTKLTLEELSSNLVQIIRENERTSTDVSVTSLLPELLASSTIYRRKNQSAYNMKSKRKCRHSSLSETNLVPQGFSFSGASVDSFV